jgi:hypothetical protein
VLICEGFGLVAVCSGCEDSTIFSTYTINGRAMENCRFSRRIRSVVTFVGPSDLDYFVLADERGKVVLFMAHQFTMVKWLTGLESMPTGIHFDAGTETLFIGTKSGHVCYGQLGLGN